jgi:hypothetical protein
MATISSECALTLLIAMYLGHTKSSGSSTFFAYRKFEIIFFLYKKIERRLLYFSMLSDHYSSNVEGCQRS